MHVRTCQLTGTVKPQPASHLGAPICNRAEFRMAAARSLVRYPGLHSESLRPVAILTNDQTIKKYRWFSEHLSLARTISIGAKPSYARICLVNNHAIGSTERKTSGVSYSITSPCGLSMGGISADAACGITRCAGSKLQDRAGLQASIRARPDAGHSIQFCCRRHAWQLCGVNDGKRHLVTYLR